MAVLGGDLLKGNVLTLILTLLEGEPMYGLQIAKEIARRSGGAFQFKEGLLYPSLHQLEKEGLVVSEWHRSGQGPDRKYYALTRKGRREGARRRKRWSAFTKAMGRVIEGGSGE
jgi:PadR family transcriptional regulator PadR